LTKSGRFARDTSPDWSLRLTRPDECTLSFQSRPSERVADSGLSDGKLLRKEDYLKSGNSRIAF
jgi:hypothetical protein